MYQSKWHPLKNQLYFTACYRPPECTEDYNTKLIKGISNIVKKYKQNPHWICGDFNLPDIDWESNTINGKQNSKKINENFLETFVDQLNLSQIVNFTTRKSNILDLILTNRPGLTERCEPDIGFSDHETAIIEDIFCHPQKIKPVQQKVNLWHRADINALQNDIKNEIDKFCTSNTTETYQHVLGIL